LRTRIIIYTRAHYTYVLLCVRGLASSRDIFGTFVCVNNSLVIVVISQRSAPGPPGARNPIHPFRSNRATAEAQHRRNNIYTYRYVLIINNYICIRVMCIYTCLILWIRSCIYAIGRVILFPGPSYACIAGARSGRNPA